MGAIILKGDLVLLVERGHRPLKGYWSLPGGVLETGEKLEEGIRREVLEETGLIIRPIRVVEIFERIMRDAEGAAEYHYVLIDFLCEVISGELQAAGDAADAQWFTSDQVSTLPLPEDTAAVIRLGFEKARDSRR